MNPELIDFQEGDGSVESFRREVLHGLLCRRKRIAPKYFYDRRGSELFEEICALPEYYVTRTELALLRENAAAIADRIGERATLIELGSGASRKTRLLLDSLQAPEAYVPIDISRSFLLDSARKLAQEYFPLPVIPICADYTGFLHPLREALSDRPNRVIYFPGSTIGNLERVEAVEFLKNCSQFLSPGGRMLVGFDLLKDVKVLEAAYNDSQGVTARFNLNLLERINRELGADFQPELFQHHAYFNLTDQRIEMHLVSREEQRVEVAGQPICFGMEETIHTESSHKYSLSTFDVLLRHAGLKRTTEWIDPDRLFCIAMLEVEQKRSALPF